MKRKALASAIVSGLQAPHVPQYTDDYEPIISPHCVITQVDSSKLDDPLLIDSVSLINRILAAKQQIRVDYPKYDYLRLTPSEFASLKGICSMFEMNDSAHDHLYGIPIVELHSAQDARNAVFGLRGATMEQYCDLYRI